jgi:hypothetical protein
MLDERHVMRVQIFYTETRFTKRNDSRHSVGQIVSFTVLMVLQNRDLQRQAGLLRKSACKPVVLVR